MVGHVPAASLNQQEGLMKTLVEIMKFGYEERVGCTSLDMAKTFDKAHDQKGGTELCKV